MIEWSTTVQGAFVLGFLSGLGLAAMLVLMVFINERADGR
jgi:hypothetical protein